LLLEKLRRKRGVGFRQRVDAAQQQQVMRTLERAPKRAIRLVDAR
jgi:ribosomal protein L34